MCHCGVVSSEVYNFDENVFAKNDTMSSAVGSNDKTANKVALCSAMFAGFAYVGYSMVRTAFGRKGKRDSEGKKCSVYFVIKYQR